MTFEMTQKEAHTLAAFVALIRSRCGGPEWHKAGIEDALGRARKVAPAPDLAIAAIRAAREPLNRTPAVIGLEGPHWQGSQTPPRRPYDANKTCGTCGFSQPECRRRWSEDHEFESVAQAKARHANDGTAVDRAVQGLKEAALDAPPERPTQPTTTEGTERVAPIREALHQTTEAPPGRPDDTAEKETA